MRARSSMVSIALAVALSMAGAGAQAFDDAKYPDWKGQWVRIGGGQWDPTKPTGLGQQAPLTAEAQAILEASVADQAAGGQGNDPQYKCLPPGMPRAMIVIQPLEIVVTPETTFMNFELFSMLRRVYTDGRDWPKEVEPSFMGYSIGKWVDEDGDGRYDALLIETRGVKGPHTFDSSGLPFHPDNEAVFKERIYSDKANPDILHNDITTIDHALTRPWTVTRNYRRERQRVVWTEYVCHEDNRHVIINDRNYVVNWDGYLMPTRKDQAPPDLKYFSQAQK
jgi:hypothetical protein